MTHGDANPADLAVCSGAVRSSTRAGCRLGLECLAQTPQCELHAADATARAQTEAKMSDVHRKDKLSPEEASRRKQIYEYLMAHKDEILREAMVEAADSIAREAQEQAKMEDGKPAPVPARG